MSNVFSTNLKKYRTIKNIGINELGRLVGVSGAYISSLEKGTKANPSLDLLYQIANVLETTIISLIGEEKAEFEINKIEDLVAIITHTDSLTLDNIAISKKERLKLSEQFINALNLVRYSRLNIDNLNND